MGSVGTAELAFRLAVAVFAIVAPTLLFVGMMRTLERVRDDDLVTRVLAEAGYADEAAFYAAVGTRFAATLAGESDEPSGVRCGNCGATNLSEATVCSACLSEIESGRR